MLDKIFGIIKLIAALLAHYASYRAGKNAAALEEHDAIKQNQTTRAKVAADIAAMPDAGVSERLRARWRRD